MHKVVIERPRWNPGPGKHGRRGNLPDEQLPKFEGIKRPHDRRKGLTDLLGPLRRWLRSQVGRPWNDVYSEACAVIKPDSIIRMHVKTHLLEFVERNACVQGGRVCVLEKGYRGRGIIPITEQRYGWTLFFVHPVSGLLEELKLPSKEERRLRRRKKQEELFRWINPVMAVKQISGIWYACQFRVTDPYGPFKAYDHAAGEIVGRGGLVRRERDYLHCILKRQLSKRELRRYGLQNSVKVSTGAQSSGHHADALTTALLFSAGRRMWVIEH